MMAKKADLYFTIDYVSLPSWQPNDVHAPIIHYVSLSMKYLCKLSEIDLSFCRYKPIKSTHQEIQFNDVNTRTIEIPPCTGFIRVNCSLKVYNAFCKLPSPISG